MGLWGVLMMCDVLRVRLSGIGVGHCVDMDHVLGRRLTNAGSITIGTFADIRVSVSLPLIVRSQNLD